MPPSHRDLSRAEIRAALCAGAELVLFAKPQDRDAARVKISASVRHLRLNYRTEYDEGTWRMRVFTLPEPEPRPNTWEVDDVSAAAELAAHARVFVERARAGSDVQSRRGAARGVGDVAAGGTRVVATDDHGVHVGRSADRQAR